MGRRNKERRILDHYCPSCQEDFNEYIDLIVHKCKEKHNES